MLRIRGKRTASCATRLEDAQCFASSDVGGKLKNKWLESGYICRAKIPKTEPVGWDEAEARHRRVSIHYMCYGSYIPALEETRALPGRVKNPYQQSRNDAFWYSAVSRPSPHSQAGVRTSGTPRVNKKSRLFYYPVRIDDSPRPAHDRARGSLHRRRPLRFQGSRSAPVAPPRAKSLLYLAAGGEDNTRRRLLAALTVVQIGSLESVFEICKPFV
ncbi:hypothetical protein CHGG_04282 [Chaetomium globosum CBS 148.51]|uniref:Uncharacterized protein n=1 Tax=Chaetomium globosum (strain ATCC 6205 / CBS 148.51 / DSM 1962 / NBRC 6347 / NRRL 1970) TaxID=306901 RepID=Q2H1R4_CHAGB|nr:uncharacterized protein CHGG_04282 [Chaetomium globosum CBS 148.51]EAQ87663.1 hypothetical protein CHGG_04282 [Chaetomium globosum CBS 148.51]